MIAIGEFGRTPKINSKGGRDHWGLVFSFAMAGAGISGGQVYGASDANGAYPSRDPVYPPDLTATIFHLLGIDYQGTFHDREGRSHRLTSGSPLFELLGMHPSTQDRVTPSGDIGRVPPYDGNLLLNTHFKAAATLRSADGPSRPKGWRAKPLTNGHQDNDFGVWQWAIDDLSPNGEHPYISMGFGFAGGRERVEIDQGSQAVLAQEARSPFAGSYRLLVRASGGGVSRDYYDTVFARHFTCRILFYQYSNQSKKVTERPELAVLPVKPGYVDSPTDLEMFELKEVFMNPRPGGNFSFGLGMSVAILVEKTSHGRLELPTIEGPHQAYIRVASVGLEFVGKDRIDDVMV